MSLTGIERLLQPLSSAAPCGDNLEYDPDFAALKKAAQPKPAPEFDPDSTPEPPDWHEVQTRALELLARSKDLDVAVHLIKALLCTQGFPGFRDGLELLRGLLEQYWETLYPQLDPDDNNDPTLRVNLLASLCDPEFMLRPVRETALVSSRLGRFSLRDIHVATGALKLPKGSMETLVELSSIDAAFMDTDLEALQTTAAAVHDSIDAATAIEAELTARVGITQAPNLSGLMRILQEIQTFLFERLARRGVSEPAVTASAEPPTASVPDAVPQAVTPLSGDITCREDVIRVLDRICDYYRRYEPSSPVPLLLQRARRLVSRDFLEILRDLVPDGVPQVEKICGSGE
ncbi:MAG: type VI secretion system protein TssA [Candidatus Competibacteraceae bacterium]